MMKRILSNKSRALGSAVLAAAAATTLVVVSPPTGAGHGTTSSSSAQATPSASEAATQSTDALLADRTDTASRSEERLVIPESLTAAAPEAAAVEAVPAPEPNPVEVAIATGDNRAIGQAMAAERGWTGYEWTALELLWTRESQWNDRAMNASSGAYGIPQSLPGSKMASAGADWQTNPVTQITWGLDYIAGRYGSPSAAWAHSQAVGWY
jgi:hypothetical protein